MLNGKKIGMKIATGIGVMLLIITIVIGVTIFNTSNMKKSSTQMSKVNLVNVKMSQEINALTSAMRIEMKGYLYTSDPKTIELVNQLSASIGDKLNKSEAFTMDHKTELSLEVQKNTDDALIAYNTYVKGVEDYKANITKFMDIKTTLLSTVEEFYANVASYEEKQMSDFKIAVANTNTTNSVFDARLKKIVGIKDITNSANLARIYANKALEARDATYFDKSLDVFPVIYATADKMSDKDALSKTIASAKKYESNLVSFKALMLEQQSLQAILFDSGNKLLELSNQVLTSSLNQSIVDATSNENSANFTNIFLIVGFVTAFILGTLVNLQVIRGITRNINKVTKAADLIAIGDTSFELVVDSKDEIGQLTEAFNRMKENISTQSQLVKELAEGNTDLDVKILSEKDILNIGLKGAVEAINRMVEDINRLTLAAVDGKLDVRVDESKHQGEYQEIVKGINKTLDMVIEPIKEASMVLEEFARGNLSASVNGNYKGDHAVIKNALNNTVLNVSAYIKETAEVLNKMADGNLVVQINSDFKGDFGMMKNAINNIVDSLNEVLGEINMASEQVATGSRQVAQSSQALSHGSTNQASSIEEITASMTEIAEQTKENAINASKANEFSNLAKDAASKGNQQMVEMVTAMKDINDSSANISKIISVIDEIAFQTNILALNAAVEAARAGQHGKGFAVVAEEVRNLAARSANAAKETTVMIENSVIKVGKGMNIASDTAKALEEIVGGASKAADLVANIAYASNEQATAISQINEGIYQVSQVTQNNTATAEESAAASEEMTSQAQMLKEMVSRFKLKKGRGSSKMSYVSPAPTYYEAPNSNFKNNEAFSISLDDDEFGKY
jgi:methyl-accepting chemotaxis protein